MGLVVWEGGGWGKEREGGAGRAMPELCGEQFSLVTSLDSFLKYHCLSSLFFKACFLLSFLELTLSG